MGDNLSEDAAGTEDVTEAPLDPAGQALLRWLRWLVTGLAVVMSIGMLVVAAVLWLRLGPGAMSGPGVQTQPGAIPALPANLQLPAGVKPAAVTFARDWLVIIDEGGEILLYDRAGSLRQRVLPD